jgi:hypothetical protein
VKARRCCTGDGWWHIVHVVRAGHVVVVIALLVTVAGCGGDDDTTTAGTTAAENVRLSTESWDTYTAALAEAQKVNQPAITQFAKCRDLVARNAGSEQLEQCFSTTTSKVVAEGRQFLATLEGFEDEVEGACAKSLTDYAGIVKLYIASVNGLSSGEQTSPSAAQVDEASGALVRARTAGAAFEAACKPAA